MENKCTLTPEQIKEVKADGFLINRGTNQFSARIITENGTLTGEQMSVLSEAASRFGNGTMAFTVRLTVELPGIEYDNIAAFREFVGQVGLQTGGTGAKVRPLVACKGTTCVFGLCDTQGIAKNLHKYFFVENNTALPHKFKIAVGGCPNNCAKPDLNDVGVVGQRQPNFNLDACRGCKKCGVVAVCPMKACIVEDGKLKVDPALCNNCGRCVGNCYFNINKDYIDACKIYIGGRWGKKIRLGTALSRLFTLEEMPSVVERAMLLFRDEGIKGERFAETIERLGVDYVDSKLTAK